MNRKNWKQFKKRFGNNKLKRLRSKLVKGQSLQHNPQQILTRGASRWVKACNDATALYLKHPTEENLKILDAAVAAVAVAAVAAVAAAAWGAARDAEIKWQEQELMKIMNKVVKTQLNKQEVQ